MLTLVAVALTELIWESTLIRTALLVWVLESADVVVLDGAGIVVQHELRVSRGWFIGRGVTSSLGSVYRHFNIVRCCSEHVSRVYFSGVDCDMAALGGGSWSITGVRDMG